MEDSLWNAPKDMGGAPPHKNNLIGRSLWLAGLNLGGLKGGHYSNSLSSLFALHAAFTCSLTDAELLPYHQAEETS